MHSSPCHAPAVPPIWHHNPLAGSPPKQWTALQLPTQPPQQQTPPRPAAPAGDGAVTVRALPSPDKAAWQALLGAGPEPAADGHSQHQAQGEAGAEWQGRASGASSPSLRLPASEASSGRQQAASEQQELIVLRAQQPHPTLQLPADSKGSNGVPSLSQHWSLPSPGPGNS